MKKIYFTLGLSALLFGANAQQLKKVSSFHKNVANTKFHGFAKTQSTVIDTLVTPSIADSACAQGASGITYYGWNETASRDSGFIFGTSVFPITGYTLTAVAQKYTVTGAATVTDVLMIAGTTNGGTVTTTAKIYSDNTTSHEPNTTLGTSNPLAMSALTATGINTYHFATPVALSAGNFYPTITIPAFGGADKDTLAVSSTQQGCTSKDSLSVMQLNGNVWIYARTLFSSQQAYDFDLAIFPVINITNNAGIDKVTKGGLSLFAAYPNPTNTTININFSLDKSSKVDVEIYDISGKIVKTISNNNLAMGTNSIAVDVSTLEAGSYLYSINAAGNKMFSRFVVTK